MPLLPTTSRSYPPASAVSTRALDGSPSTTVVSIFTPDLAWRLASRSTTACAPSPRPAVMIVTEAPTVLARSTARSTAFDAVLDPSVPTRIFLNTAANLARRLLGGPCLRELHGRWLDALDGAEDDLVVLGVDDDVQEGAELLPQDP